MLKPLIRTLNGWRFELPLALVLGASVAFAIIAMPYSPFAAFPAIAAHGLLRPLGWAFAAAAALLAGIAGFRAMKHPWGGTADMPADAQEVEAEAPPIDVSLRLRRSDAHPDFPPREPIIASRDLGEPFMDVTGFGDGSDAPVGGSGPRVLDGEYVELSETETEAEPVEAPVAIAQPVPEDEPLAEFEPVAEAEPAVAEVEAEEPEPMPVPTPVEAAPPAAPTLTSPPPLTLVEDIEEDPSIAAFTPEPAVEPALQPERARRESLTDMMERLSAGLERRAGTPLAPPPADKVADMLARPRAATPELRDALNELNRLAGRRG
jgi:hypothetical protein